VFIQVALGGTVPNLKIGRIAGARRKRVADHQNVAAGSHPFDQFSRICIGSRHHRRYH
jgi:hypothetical protein